MKMKRVSQYILSFLLVLFVCVSFAHAAASTVQNPVTDLQSTINKLQNEISSQHASLTKSPAKLYAVMKDTLIPMVAVDRMAAMTLGPKWRTATAEQKKDFVAEFSKLLTRTYARSLLQVNNYIITIFPLRGDRWKTASQLAIRGKLAAKGSQQSSAVTYYVERNGSDWKIYDFAVEGVSFVKNFQAQFQSYANISDLIAKLTKLNAAQANAS